MFIIAYDFLLIRSIHKSIVQLKGAHIPRLRTSHQAVAAIREIE